MTRVAPAELSRRAAALLRAGKRGEALAAYRDLLDRDAERPGDWFNYALLLRGEGRAREALAAYGEALDRGVAGAEEVHLNRAVILAEDLADPAAAHRELDRALELAPGFVPALLNRGNLHEDAGDREAARKAYRHALRLQPNHALALTRLAEVTRFETADDPLLARLRQFAAHPRMPALGRADLGFALGRGLDQSGAFDEAFAAYTAANAASAEWSGAVYEPVAEEARIDALIQAFPDTPDPDGQAGAAPIFICGMFRSGSTLVERILAAHDAITPGGELPILPRLVEKDLAPYPRSAAKAAPDVFAGLRDRYLAALAEIGLEPAGLTDKRPDNFLHVGLIKRLFPAAKIVVTRRNPLDNCLSIFFAHLAPELAYAQRLESAAHWYRQHQRLVEHWQALYPEDIHPVDYDALVREPRDVIEPLLEFLGLDWDEACLAPHDAAGEIRTASAWQVREPLYSRSSGRWRNYVRHLDPLFAEFGKPE